MPDDGFGGTVLRIATRGFELTGNRLDLAAGEVCAVPLGAVRVVL